MNNLFKDYKHNNSFLDLVNYKLGYIIYNFMCNKNHPNFIINGVHNSGKTLLMKTIMNDLFNVKNYTNKQLFCDNIYYDKSHIHYHFDLRIINNNINFIPFIKDIVKSCNYFFNNYNYIILDNFEYLSDINQNKLRVIFEKSVHTTKIIIITSKINNIIEPLKSRFSNFRIPKHYLFDKYIYFKKILLKNNLIINECILIDILKKHDDINYNIINIFSYLKTGIINNDIYDEIIIKYMNIINSKHGIQKKIIDMKQLIYLSRSIIDINTFYRRFFKYLLDLNISNDKKYNLITAFKDNDILVNKSFKDLLYLEGLLIEVYQILTTSS